MDDPPGRGVLLRCTSQIKIHISGDELRELRFSPDGSVLAAGTDIGSRVLWNTETFDQLKQEPDDCLFDPNPTPGGRSTTPTA
jgi:hypothetical protein